MGRKTKKQKEAEEIEKNVEIERVRVIELLKKADAYSLLLDPMIETYLDNFRVYKIMYKRWSDKGFPATGTYENKNGAKNAVKHPLSVQVDIWSEKKTKALERLGMTNKAIPRRTIVGGSTVNSTTGDAEEKPKKASDKLKAQREKWKKLAASKAGGAR